MGELLSPTGYAITGTFEKLSGRSNINDVLGKNPDGTYDLDYEGYTEVFWDDQKTIKRLNETTDKVERIFLDEMGDEWFESQLTFSDESTPRCDICGEPDGEGEPDWNGDTGNHLTCEREAND